MGVTFPTTTVSGLPSSALRRRLSLDDGLNGNGRRCVVMPPTKDLKRTPIAEVKVADDFELVLSDVQLKGMSTLEKNARNIKLAHIRDDISNPERSKLALNRLWEENIYLAYDLVRKSFRNHYTLQRSDRENYTTKEDLIEAAITRDDGLRRAASEFDPNVDTEFSTYAMNLMYYAVKRHLCKKSGPFEMNDCDARRYWQGVKGGLQIVRIVRLDDDKDSRRVIDDIAEEPDLSFEGDDCVERTHLFTPGPETNEFFWSRPYELRRALRQLGDKPLDRLAYELSILRGLPDDLVLQIAQDEKIVDGADYTTLLFAKKRAIKKMDKLLPMELPVIEGTKFTIKDLIEGLVSHPEWALLLSENEGDAIFYYYYLIESYDHECYDIKTKPPEIGKLFFNEKAKSYGVKRQAISAFIDSAKRKLIGLQMGSYTKSDAAKCKAEGTSSKLYNKLLEINSIKNAS